MKFISLSGNASKACNAIKFKSSLVMLDCALDTTTTMPFLPLPLVHSNHLSSLPNWTPKDIKEPQLENVFNHYFDFYYQLLKQLSQKQELKECCGRVFIDSAPEFCVPETSTINLKHVDVILISNYQSILALPYITERTEFNGVVYATEPTLQIAKQFMEEMIKYIERTPKAKLATVWKKPHVYKHIPLPFVFDTTNTSKPYLWQQIYSIKEMNSCLSKIKVIGFSEQIDIFGSLQASALSAGYCIGSCNWIITSNHEKIVYLSNSSTLTTHPKPMDHIPLRNADVLILNNLSQTPHVNPDSMLGEFCVNIGKALQLGGNVLVPCYSSGVIYDLLECLSVHLEQSGHVSVPMYFISPVADHSLAYSNILAEWLTNSKQSRVYIPEEPFPHASLVRGGRLKHFSGISLDSFNTEFKTPCIVFTGHPSLRFGDVVHLIELWGNSPNNLIVFTEPDFPYMEALSPYQPLSMRVVYCPIDTSLNFSQANKLLRDLKPKNLIIPQSYTTPPPLLKHRTDLVIDCESTVFTYKRNYVIKLPIKRRFERIDIDSDLASSLLPVEVRSGVSIATVTGSLLAKDNKFKLQLLTKTQMHELTSDSPTHTLPPLSYTWGSIDIQLFMSLISKAGIYDAVVEQNPNGCVVQIRSQGTVIQMEENSTTIVCDYNSKIRLLLRDIIAECLKRI